MKLDSIFLKNNSEFAQVLRNWALENNYDVQEYPDKNDEPDKGINGLVIFNENQTVDKEDVEVRAIFDHNQKPVHKIDINGTLMVGLSNLELWLERNKCKKVLFIGSDSLLQNQNLERYLESFK